MKDNTWSTLSIFATQKYANSVKRSRVEGGKCKTFDALCEMELCGRIGGRKL